MSPKAGLALLVAAALALLGVPAGGGVAIFASWILAAAGFAALQRHGEHQRGARFGLLALILLVGFALVGGGVTLGVRGQVLARLEAILPPSILVDAGIVAAWVAIAAFLAASPARRERRLARAGIAISAAGAMAILAVQLTQANYFDVGAIRISKSALSFLVILGAPLLMASFALAIARGVRHGGITRPSS